MDAAVVFSLLIMRLFYMTICIYHGLHLLVRGRKNQGTIVLFKLSRPPFSVREFRMYSLRTADWHFRQKGLKVGPHGAYKHYSKVPANVKTPTANSLRHLVTTQRCNDWLLLNFLLTVYNPLCLL